MNQTIDTLLKRRSIRKYKSDQISDADLKLILDTGLYAPTLIIALSLTGHGNAMADCALALGNMQNAAASLGLGSCYVNQMHWLTDNSNLREYVYKLGMRADEDIYGCMVLGYPDQPVQNPAARIEGRIVIIK